MGSERLPQRHYPVLSVFSVIFHDRPDLICITPDHPSQVCHIQARTYFRKPFNCFKAGQPVRLFHQKQNQQPEHMALFSQKAWQQLPGTWPMCFSKILIFSGHPPSGAMLIIGREGAIFFLFPPSSSFFFWGGGGAEKPLKINHLHVDFFFAMGGPPSAAGFGRRTSPSTGSGGICSRWTRRTM